MMSGSQPGVDPASCTLNSGSAIASTTAIRRGMYSGRQPAITPLTAILQTVAARFSGERVPITSAGDRSANSRKRSTRGIVGGITGSPSVHRRA